MPLQRLHCSVLSERVLSFPKVTNFLRQQLFGVMNSIFLKIEFYFPSVVIPPMEHESTGISMQGSKDKMVYT